MTVRRIDKPGDKQRRWRRKKYEQGLFEVRGIYAPRELHDTIKRNAEATVRRKQDLIRRNHND